MKYIFLDFDGVISPSKQYTSERAPFYAKFPKAKLLGVPYAFCSECIEILNQFLVDGVEIIISSDWKDWNSFKDLCDIFEMNGIKKLPIAITPNLHYNGPNESRDSRRIREIEEYLSKNQIDNWIVIDDLDLSKFGKRFIKTNQDRGLNDPEVIGLISEFINEVPY